MAIKNKHITIVAVIIATPGILLTANLIIFALFGVGFLPAIVDGNVFLARLIVWVMSYLLAAFVAFSWIL